MQSVNKPSLLAYSTLNKTPLHFWTLRQFYIGKQQHMLLVHPSLSCDFDLKIAHFEIAGCKGIRGNLQNLIHGLKVEFAGTVM